jgi:succinate dehydrogenase/fumarate reductase flavoprotein subunit
MIKKELVIDAQRFPVYQMDTVIIGTGAASLNCADHLYDYGHKDIALVTEKIGGGTSNNTGSDKQTYYKLSLSGKEPDCPYEMAKSLFDGGAMHGDLALIEATMSSQEFFHLAHIGVKFPHDRLGGFVGYKTDHDPRQRATSAGPWTSHQMVQCLLTEVQAKNIPIFDEHDVIALIVQDGRTIGLVALDKTKLAEETFGLCFFQAQNVVLGVGGPGGLYKTSVYPECHTGAIGLALECGAVAANLTESQYGLASIKFRWNVSGTYQQVIPRYISTAADGCDEQEFLNAYFPNMAKLATDVFLKGYQWPFDPRKIPNYGSSLVDVLVYIETVIKGRRVYMDFRENPRGDQRIGAFSFDTLETEAHTYLQNSAALFGNPFARLQKMNPLAIELYRNNGIDLAQEPLEIAVCSQHNNGGLAGDQWWQSSIPGLYAIGEVNGSHGVYRPGGSALNSGQVGSLRAAQKIAHTPAVQTVSDFEKAAEEKGRQMLALMNKLLGKTDTSAAFRDEFQSRMTQYGAHIRDPKQIHDALAQAYEQCQRVNEQQVAKRQDIPLALQNRHLVLAHTAYLEAIHAYLERGGGSRGSYMIMDPRGEPVLESLGAAWRYRPETVGLRDWVLETQLGSDGRFHSQWHQRRPLPEENSWFETVWGKYLSGEIFQTDTK